MSLSHQLLTLYASATVQINPNGAAPEYCNGVTVSIQNLHGSNYVYIGNSSTSSVAFGFRLSPGQSWSADIDTSDALFLTSNGTSSVAITRLFWQ
jgi:hypothetical protein